MIEQKNVTLTMSVSGIRELIGWLESTEDKATWLDKTFTDYLGFLKSLVEAYKNYE